MNTCDGKLPVNRKLRAAIIGCGRVAGGYDIQANPEIVNTHAKAYTLEPATELVAVADIDYQCAQRFSKHWGNPAVYSNVQKMLFDEQPDIVSICTPDNTHASILEMCLESSTTIRAVWSEKPLATDVRRAEKIVAAYEEKGVALAVNYQRRWDEQLQSIKGMIPRNGMGNIQKVLVFYTKGICHNGSHAIDLLMDWFGQAMEMQVFGYHIDFIPEDPTVDARLILGNTPVYLIGIDEREYTLFEIHILGTSGRVIVKSNEHVCEWYQKEPDPHFEGYQILRLHDKNIFPGHVPPMSCALQEIVHSIFNGGTVRSSGVSALATLRVCHNLAKQALEKS